MQPKEAALLDVANSNDRLGFQYMILRTFAVVPDKIRGSTNLKTIGVELWLVKITSENRGNEIDYSRRSAYLMLVVWYAASSSIFISP